MITGRELTCEEKESLAKEVRQFLMDNELWTDVRIYFNGKAFCSNQGDLEDEDPRAYFKYVSGDDILSMSFEGDFYGCMNFNCAYGADFDSRIQMEFSDILEEYGDCYELGNAWNLTCSYLWK
jgi:hypothetical protein